MLRPPFNLDKYEYEAGGYYPAFKASVDEKLCAAMVSAAVADGLRKEKMVYDTLGTIAVADIGSGPADSIQMYLAGANHPAGFNLHAMDFNAEYAGPDGKAHDNLRDANRDLIKSFSVKQGEVPRESINSILGTEANHFPIAFISHMIYHMKPQDVPALINDVAANVVKKDGVAVMFHLEKTDNPKSFQYFRAKYGKPSPADNRNIPATEVGNPPQAVQDACEAAHIPCHTLRYTNNYYFDPMNNAYWETFKHPEKYHLIADEKAIANLRKLYFIPQRAANEFAADHGSNGLSAFIDEVRKVIAPDPSLFAKQGGFMDLAETVQLVGSTHAPEETRAKLERVSSDIQDKLPGLEKAAFARWQREWAKKSSYSLAG